MMWLMAAGAALQIVLFQLLIWSLQSGARLRSFGLAAAIVAVSLVILAVYRRNVSTR